MRTTKRLTLIAMATLAAGLLLNVGIGSEAKAAQAVGPGPDGKETLSQTYRESRMDDVEYQKSVKPFKVFDNLWYVGPGYVSVWLLKTNAGLILIDSAQEPYVDWVIDNIRQAGFDPKDIKYILLSHGHIDHFGGAAKIQEASGGARVALGAIDWPAVEATGARPGRGGQPAPRVPKRDIELKDGDVITLGEQSIKFYFTPGHTPGTMSAEFTVWDNGVPHKAFWSGGSGGRGGLEGAQQALDSANRLNRDLKNIDVATPAHAWTGGNPYPNGSIFERLERLKARKPGDPNPFVDPASFKQWLTAIQKNAVELVAEEKAKLAAGPAPAAPAGGR